jgi:hypothetical protein
MPVAFYAVQRREFIFPPSNPKWTVLPSRKSALNGPQDRRLDPAPGSCWRRFARFLFAQALGLVPRLTMPMLLRAAAFWSHPLGAGWASTKRSDGRDHLANTQGE